jgi:hypothetical protein
MRHGVLQQPSRSGNVAKCHWKRILVGAAFVSAFIAAARDLSVHACSCGRAGSFVMNQESDDKTLILPRDSRGVLWWGVEGERQTVQKGNFAVRLLSGARERNLDFTVIEVKPALFLIVTTEKLAPGNRYLFSHQDDRYQPPRAQKVEAIVENTAFAAIKDQVQLWLVPSRLTQLAVAADGLCSRSAEMVTQDVHIVEPAAIERWRFALLFETVLDGKPDWKPRDHVCGSYPPGSSWQGHGSDMIFAECASADPNRVAGTREGEHDVYMSISLPGTNLVATTKKESFRLTCTSPGLK